MLDFEEEALDEVALAVERIVAGYLRGCFSGRDDRHGALACDRVAQMRGVVAFVAKDVLGREVGDQAFGLGDIAGLAGCQDEAQGIAQCIDDGMNLGGQSAARATDRASFRPPFLPAAC